MGASVEGELHLAMDSIVSYPIQFLLFFVLFIFLFKRIVGGHCPGLVTSGDSITHKNFMKMRGLTRDDTPFLLAMPPRPTTLVLVTIWMTLSYHYMPMNLIGWLMMRPPIHQLDIEFYFILWVPFSC
jgi:hypothetical protein